MPFTDLLAQSSTSKKKSSSHKSQIQSENKFVSNEEIQSKYPIDTIDKIQSNKINEIASQNEILSKKIVSMENLLTSTIQQFGSKITELQNQITTIDTFDHEETTISSIMTYDEFRDFVFENRNKGTHFSTYYNQAKHHRKETDIKNMYLIYLELNRRIIERND